MANADSGKKKCECICPCKETEESGTISLPVLPGGLLAARDDATAVVPSYVQKLQTDAAQVNVSAGVRVLQSGTARSTESTVVPGVPGADVFVVPSLYLPRLDAGADMTRIGGGWIGVSRPGGVGGDQRGGAGARTTWKFVGGQWVQPGSDARPERGSLEEEGRAAGPLGQYKGIKRTEEEDKRIRAEAAISEAHVPTIARKPALSPGGKAAVASAKDVHKRFDADAAAGQHALSEQQKRIQADMAAAGISSDLPQGPGASSSQFNVKDPSDQPAMWSGDFDVTSQKGTEAYAQAGLGAATQFKPSEKSELQARRDAEARAKRMQAAAGAAPSAQAPQQPGLNTIRATSSAQSSDASAGAEVREAPLAAGPSTIFASTVRSSTASPSVPAPTTSAPGGIDNSTIRASLVTAYAPTSPQDRVAARESALATSDARRSGVVAVHPTAGAPAHTLFAPALATPLGRTWEEEALRAIATEARGAPARTPGLPGIRMPWRGESTDLLAERRGRDTWTTAGRGLRRAVPTQNRWRRGTEEFAATSLRSRSGVRPGGVSLSLDPAIVPGEFSVAAPSAGAAIDIGSFGTHAPVAQLSASGPRVLLAPIQPDHAVETIGEDAFDTALGVASAITRPHRSGASLEATAAVSAAVLAGSAAATGLATFGFSDNDIVAAVGSMSDEAVSGLLQGTGLEHFSIHRDVALNDLTAWVTSQAAEIVSDVDPKTGQMREVGRVYDKKAYAKARSRLVKSMTHAIRRELRRQWREGGRKGRRPTTEDARRLAEAMLREAEKRAWGDDGASSADAGLVGGAYCATPKCCAEERRECEQTCPCPCECGTKDVGGDGDDPAGGKGTLSYFDDDPFGGQSWTRSTIDTSLGDESDGADRGPPRAGRRPSEIWAQEIAGRGQPPPGRGPNGRDRIDLNPGSAAVPGFHLDTNDDVADLRLGDLEARPGQSGDTDALPRWDELSESQQHFLLLILMAWMYRDPERIAENDNAYWEFVPFEGERNLSSGVATIGAGLKAGLFRYRGGGRPTPPSVLAFQGTVEVYPDWLRDNPRQALGLKSAQYEDAVRTAQVAANQLGADGIHYVIGHSLGGGLAQYVGLSFGLPVVTLNPAPLHRDSIQRAQATREALQSPETVGRGRLHWSLLSAAAGNDVRITNYSVHGDPVSDSVLPRALPGNALVGETRVIPRTPEVTWPTPPRPPVLRRPPALRTSLSDLVELTSLPTILSPPRRQFEDQTRRALDVARDVMDASQHAVRAARQFLDYSKAASSYATDLAILRAIDALDSHMAIEGIEEYVRAIRNGVNASW